MKNDFMNFALSFVLVTSPVVLVNGEPDIYTHGQQTSEKMSKATINVVKLEEQHIVKKINGDILKTSKLPKHVQDYIDTNYHIAREVADSFGLDWLYVLAQPAIESGWGTSNIAINGNNLFGIKKMKNFPSIGKYTKFPDVRTGFGEYCRLINKYREKATTTEEIAYTISRSKYVSKEKQDNKYEADRYMNKILSAAKMIKTYLDAVGVK